MPLRYVEFFTAEAVRADRTVLWIWGDNLAEKGKAKGAGQAEACRYEPNTLGIPTKRAPSMRPDAFLCDDDLDCVKAMAIPRFRKTADHLLDGGVVVLPTGGIGTGRARLAESAPVIARWLESCFAHLRSIEAEALAAAAK